MGEFKKTDKVKEDQLKTEIVILSTLPKTWILDLDGTLVKHNGYKSDGHDSLLEGVKDYMDNIPQDDYIMIITSRAEEYRKITADFLEANGIRYNQIVFNVPVGERILVNDQKPSGIDMAVAINLTRDSFQMPIIRRET